MKQPSVYLKMRVLGAIDTAPGRTRHERIYNVAAMTFLDEGGIVRSADGVLRKARNLCVGCMIEAVRSANKTIDIDNVNRVLMQPHWQKESDLVDF
jgi:hypothetical protein